MMRILRLALDRKDVDELEDFDFGKVPATTNKEERNLLRCIRHTLQRLCFQVQTCDFFE
ncbi:hypothetical protein INT45_004114 [Circinella minor]|uniref:Uncharacterized protein n=1 Tax=Circinella minor TaxID=1195481 RepID=A0A8H7VGZ3_9FUNG|nr:hypothetical protein INT45_004114 [Circinella minor]